ncbi:MAG: polyisoprenoid-binding protein [Robiginitomaculum sp.]|nr:MAG: polyisoprenoid-binding protein [Robiginitomaculum sp.]
MKKQIQTLVLAGTLLGAATYTLSGTAQTPKFHPDETHKMAAPYENIGVPSGAYTMDKTHGYVTFSYSHFDLSNPQLRFRDIDAVLVLDADMPENSVLSVEIDAASIDSGVDIFDEHLNSPDWFDTAKHGEISFKSTGFTRTGTKAGTMSGDLTIMGITKPLTLDVTLLAAKPHPFKKVPAIGIEARGTLLRSDFGLGKYAPGVTDKVDLLISAEFHKDK